MNNKNEYYFLEINTLPGMTSTSLLPKAAKSAGLAFRDLINIIINIALNGTLSRTLMTTLCAMPR